MTDPICKIQPQDAAFLRAFARDEYLTPLERTDSLCLQNPDFSSVCSALPTASRHGFESEYRAAINDFGPPDVRLSSVILLEERVRIEVDAYRVSPNLEHKRPRAEDALQRLEKIKAECLPPDAGPPIC